MAAACLKKAILQVYLLRNSAKCVPQVTQVRNTRYDTRYQEPMIDKTGLIQGLSEDDIRRYKPIKAAKNEETTSVFYNRLLEKFTNMVMKGGNKVLARGIVDKMLENIKQMQVEKYNNATNDEHKDIECNPEVIFEQAIDNMKPVLMLTPIYKGGVLYQVPVACPAHHQRFKAMRWLIDSCRDKERKLPMERKLSWEVLDAFKNEGKCVRKKQELLRQCEANRAYAHYRW